MTIKRNHLGKLRCERHIGNRVFFVDNEAPYRVSEWNDNAIMVTEARLMPFWDKPPAFESFTQAASWLYANAENLI